MSLPSECHIDRVLIATYDALKTAIPQLFVERYVKFEEAEIDDLGGIASNLIFLEAPPPDEESSQTGVARTDVHVAFVHLTLATLTYSQRTARVKAIHDLLFDDITLGTRFIVGIQLVAPGVVQTPIPDMNIVQIEQHYHITIRRDLGVL